MKAKSTDKPAAPFEIPSDSLQTLSNAINQATERSQAMIETSLRTWETEMGRYFDEFSAHGRATMEALGKCQGPMDVLAVEQQWLRARAQAYLDSGMRFAKAFAEVARSIPVGGEEAPKAAPTAAKPTPTQPTA
jgi:uncharacterized protein HemX